MNRNYLALHGGDPTNNRIKNLEEIEASEHLSQHAKDLHKNNPEWSKSFHEKGIEAAKEWHKSPEGIEWHKQHAKNNNFGNFDLPEKNCEQCKGEYKPKTYHERFCGNNCKSRFRRDSGVDNEQRECPICGKEFTINKYSRTQTCSRKCGGVLRSNSV